jgi:hypothetical protein
MKSAAFRPAHIKSVCRLGLLLILPLVVGCGQSQGKVTGRVLIDGKPLPGGIVMFIPADPKKNSMSVLMDEQGNYEVVLPAGEVKVSVDNRQLAPHPRMATVAQLNLPADVKKLVMAKGAPPPPPPDDPGNLAVGQQVGRYVKIPDKYYDAATSGLGFKVQGGDQPHDIELSSK